MTYATFEKMLARKFATVTPDGLMGRKDAENTYGTYRTIQGFNPGPGQLLSAEVEKLKKGDGMRLLMLALAPASVSGTNVCPHSTAGCRAHCVAYSGNGQYPKITRARVARTMFLADAPVAFLSLLVHILDRETAKGPLAVRLNGFSDIRWERVLPAWFWDRYASVTFYDYTKHSSVSRPPATMPANYTLTYSVTERTTPEVLSRELTAGRNAAMVVPVKGGTLRATGKLRPLPTLDGVTVVDGDENDRRFDDPAGSVVMLRRKGTLPVGDPLVVQDFRMRALTASI